jgi:protein subunit release factor B
VAEGFIPVEKVSFDASGASGHGGQNVNKRNTKVLAKIAIDDLEISHEEKHLLRERLGKHLNKEGEIFIFCEDERKQGANKEKALERLKEIIAHALHENPERIPTEPPRSAEEIRLLEKKHNSEKKHRRHAIFLEEDPEHFS